MASAEFKSRLAVAPIEESSAPTPLNVPTLTSTRCFAPMDAKGGKRIVPSRTALLCIEFQNEFVSPAGRLHDAVRTVMEENNMLVRTSEVAKELRAEGGRVFHIPLVFAQDASDNPNPRLGILASCCAGELFKEGTPAVEFCSQMKPEDGDIIVCGKKGLDAFTGTDLEHQLIAHGIETVVLAGFLTNCCVESTMRTACEKGFNVVMLVDCTAAASTEAQKAAIGTAGLFSLPLNALELMERLQWRPEVPSGRTFAPEDAKGGGVLQASRTAVLFIEYQNEFACEGGKLHGDVKGVMEENDMLSKSEVVARRVRAAGGKVIHVPITFKGDGSDNPNMGLGILAKVHAEKLFTEDTWNAQFCNGMMPEPGDIVVRGKKGLDAFLGTDLESLLVAHGIYTLVVAGFLTNCCVESTMRTAYEKGFDVITLTDCTATVSKDAQTASTMGAFPMFSRPLTACEFNEALKNAPAGELVMNASNKPVQIDTSRCFTPKGAKGGTKLLPEKTALVLIEYQNEFVSPEGHLHDVVKEVMAVNNMLEKSARVANRVRAAGGKVIHVPITFAKDASDNPNPKLGILDHVSTNKLFTVDTWDAEICDAMQPAVDDIVIRAKRGLDSFPGTNLEEQLLLHDIETVVLAGFMTNCCVESTMRTSYEKGFNVITLIDCTATTAVEAQVAAVSFNFGFFSTPMTADAFIETMHS